MMRDDKLVRAAIKSKQPVERVLWVWGAILESAAEIDDGGRFDFDAEEAAYFLRTDINDILAVANALEGAGRVDGCFVVKWGDRQFQSDRSAERQRRYRERQKNSDSDGKQTGQCRDADEGVTSPLRHRDAPETETETETYIRETNVSLARETCQPVIDAWNDMASKVNLPRCTKLSDKRRKSCQARIKSDGVEAILMAIAHIPRSSFLRGESGSWSGASFDFLMRPDTVTNILEGKYDDRVRKAGSNGDGRSTLARVIDERLDFLD